MTRRAGRAVALLACTLVASLLLHVHHDRIIQELKAQLKAVDASVRASAPAPNLFFVGCSKCVARARARARALALLVGLTRALPPPSLSRGGTTSMVQYLLRHPLVLAVGSEKGGEGPG